MFVVQAALSERDARDYYAKKSSDQDEAMNALTKEIDDLKTKIAINEAVEITKEYSAVENDLQVKFNNKLLDNIAKVIYEQ